RPRLCRVELDGREYWSAAEPARSTPAGIQLLPAFDECLIGYQDRAAFVEAAHVRKINAGGGILKPIVMLAGRAVGTWRRAVGKGKAPVVARPFRRLAAREREALAAAVDRYAAFVGPP
ncbi:MAG TPA: crosslink repair DNA glycosylase YcaQ family protein, partial [Polyangia bacterium]